MRHTRIILPLLVALAMIASCTEQTPAPEAQQQAQKGQQAPQPKIEAAPAPVGGPSGPKTIAPEGAPTPKPEPVAKPEPKPEPVAKPEPKPEPVAKPEPKPEPVAKPTRSVPPRDRAITADRGVAKDATAPEGVDVPAAEKYVLPALETVELPSFEYPVFDGKKMTIVFTGNVIGELEPCG